MPIQITARRDGFRRLGIAHSASTVTYPDGHFSKDELAILKSDPNLIVIEVADVPESSSAADELVLAQGRIKELEAATLQLSQDGEKLKDSLAAANATIVTLTDERDELQAKLTSATVPVQETKEPAPADDADSASGTGKKKG